MTARPHITPRHPRRARRGSALLLVLIAMILLAVLSTSAVMGTMQEFKAGRNMLVQQRALTIAEYGLNGTLESWPSTRSTMAVGAIDSSKVAVVTGDTARVAVMRLNGTTFLVSSLGRSSVGNGQLESQRQVAMLVRMSAPTMIPGGAMSLLGNIDMQGSAAVSGKNTPPTGWTGCAAARDTFAISYKPGASVDSVQGPKTLTVGGNRADASLNSAGALTTFGGETWASLAARANISATNSSNPSPSGSATACTYGSNNWGEPKRTGGGVVVGCQSYFPIIYSTGDLSLSSGRGQGLLIVDGSLRINGNFTFAGIILVRDELVALGTTKIFGSVVSRNADNQTTSITGNASLTFSQCAVNQALGVLGQPSRSKHRSWVQLF
ncbi:MAG: hypothetical protein P3B76_12450 [Gemmatimonadota bacterium]|nr:hypothetical protein [Gemmatimonadota bacterium]MDQ8173486.1 hypothetical protein [Gemmatimonadota bacterium]